MAFGTYRLLHGLAERAEQTVKSSVKMSGDLEVCLQKFCMTNSLTPQATTQHTPSELMMKRKITTKLDQLRLDLAKKIIAIQTIMKESGSNKHGDLETTTRFL